MGSAGRVREKKKKKKPPQHARWGKGGKYIRRGGGRLAAGGGVLWAKVPLRGGREGNLTPAELGKMIRLFQSLEKKGGPKSTWSETKRRPIPERGGGQTSQKIRGLEERQKKQLFLVGEKNVIYHKNKAGAQKKRKAGKKFLGLGTTCPREKDGLLNGQEGKNGQEWLNNVNQNWVGKGQKKGAISKAEQKKRGKRKKSSSATETLQKDQIVSLGGPKRGGGKKIVHFSSSGRGGGKKSRGDQKNRKNNRGKERKELHGKALSKNQSAGVPGKAIPAPAHLTENRRRKAVSPVRGKEKQKKTECAEKSIIIGRGGLILVGEKKKKEGGKENLFTAEAVERQGGKREPSFSAPATERGKKKKSGWDTKGDLNLLKKKRNMSWGCGATGEEAIPAKRKKDKGTQRHLTFVRKQSFFSKGEKKKVTPEKKGLLKRKRTCSSRACRLSRENRNACGGGETGRSLRRNHATSQKIP